MSAGVPIVDIGPFLDGTSEEKRAVGEAVAGACEEIGFLLVTGHGVPGELVDDAYRLARAFFDLPPQEKLPLSTGELAPGLPVYRPVAAESLAASLGAVSPGDLKESLDWGPSLEGIGWPEQPSGLRPAWERYFEEMLRLGGTIMRIFALALGLPEEYFEDKFDKRSSSLRAINYPEPPGEPLPGQVRAGAHRDYGCLTMLLADPAPGGLQVQTRAGDWVDVVAPPGAFVVNIGDMMARWTADHWASTLHRVVNPPADRRLGSRRQSLVFFHNPAAGTLIEVLEPFREPGEEQRYAPVTAGAYILAKAEQAFTASERVARA